MPVGSVVNGVVGGTHYWPDLAINAVMNVCCPYGLNEYEQYVRQKMGPKKEEC